MPAKTIKVAPRHHDHGPAMRVAVISDIHGNLHALEAVLQAVDREQLDELWCLGDLVGYGARPNECCAVVRERADLCLVGNHDLVALGRNNVDLGEFNPEAAAAARWTRSALNEESRGFLESLEPAAEREGVELFHASPRDPVWEYVLTVEAALAGLQVSSAPLVLVGHSHVPLAISLRDGELAGDHAPAGTDRELAEGRWLLNPGSVGQPRDGDPRAAWLLLDLDGPRASFRREKYPVEETQSEIREEGLPDALATRLASGI
jgi:diadenosine tetraphosphatase ApaH/serine/threonine PP2A family protein phosphatase